MQDQHRRFPRRPERAVRQLHVARRDSSSAVGWLCHGMSFFTAERSEIDHRLDHLIVCHRRHGLVDLIEPVALADHVIEREAVTA